MTDIRDKVKQIVEYWDFSPLQDEDSRIERIEKELLEIITSQKAICEKEARLDELNRLYSLSYIVSLELGVSRTVIDWNDIKRRRIELQATKPEKEEV